MKSPKPWTYFYVFGWKIPVYKLRGVLEGGAYGFYEDESKYIAIDETLSGEVQTHTLVHELFHAALDRVFVQSQLDEKFVEVIVENLTVALMENFKVRKK